MFASCLVVNELLTLFELTWFWLVWSCIGSGIVVCEQSVVFLEFGHFCRFSWILTDFGGPRGPDRKR